MSAIWRCPDCETLNSGNKCVICGRQKPELDNNAQNSLKNKTYEKHEIVHTQSKLKESLQYNNIENGHSGSRQHQTDNSFSSSKPFKLIVVMLAVVMVLLIVAAVLLIRGKNNDNISVSGTESNASEPNNNTLTSEVTNEAALSDPADPKEEAPKIGQADIPAETVTVVPEKEPEQTTSIDSSQETSEKSTSVSVVTTVAETSKKPVSQTTASTSASSSKEWTEYAVNKEMYTTQACYSRSEAKVGAKAVERYNKGAVIYVTAVTDTSYYKLKDGSYIHSDFLSENNTLDTYNETQSATNKQIRLSKTAFTLTKGYSVYLSALNCDTSDVKWSTSNSNVATVSNNGKVVGVDPGTAFVYATANGRVCKCEVTVVAGKITSSRNSIYLSEGESVSVTIKTTGIHDIGLIEPEDPIVKIECDSSTSNKGYSTLKITGISDGDGVIRVYLKGYPEIYQDIKVSVTYPISTDDDSSFWEQLFE